MHNDARLQLLNQWLQTQSGFTKFTIAPASADASFRRYFRITTEEQTWIVMDAPPEKENCEPFVHVAHMIESVSVQAPHIYQHNKDEGFMLLSDLGSTPYLNQLNADNADPLYRDAIDSLIKMQSLQNGLPAYDQKLLQFEMSLFLDWYLGTHLQKQLSPSQQQTLQSAFDLLMNNALQQTQVFVHRDYHSRNLMITTEDNPGVIDFQDAVVGAVSYDLVSLLKDCYIAWPRKRVEEWVMYFVENNPITENMETQAFMRWFDLMGVQRHLKAIGIFARLNHRDGKSGYLNDIPRTLAYVFDTCQRHGELHDMLELLQQLELSPDKATMELIK